MKKRTAFFYFPLVVFLIFFLNFNCKKSDDAGSEETGPFTSKKWTFMFYNDADFDSAFNPMGHFSQTMYSGDNLHVIVLQDTENGQADMIYIEDGGERKVLKSMGEINMGSAETLSDFISYSKTQCPAERYIIAFYDHGGGCWGACVDTTSDDHLKMNEIKKGLNDGGGVNMVLFTAPCLMGALESVYEVRECTDVYIGSENLSGYCWWKGDPMRNFRDTLNLSPDIDLYQLAKYVIDFVYNDHSSEWDYELPNLTMSAVRTDRIIDLKDAVNELSISYSQSFGKFQQYMELYYKDILGFYDSNIDVFDFANTLLQHENNASIRTKLINLKQCLNRAVVAKCNGENFTDAGGLSIYFPNWEKNSYSTQYGDSSYGLDFSADTQWDEILEKYFDKKGIKSNLTPKLIYISRLNIF
jgi:hypothetical protein